MSESLFEVRDLRKWYSTRGESFFASIFQEQEPLKAVDDVSFSINKGEILGLAGQSGCGKSTLGKLLIGLESATDGEIVFDGRPLSGYSKRDKKDFRKRCQIVFQDPYESLNPRFPVARLVSEPLLIHGIGNMDTRNDLTLQALSDAGLQPPEKYLSQLPRELSGGERQRVSIARALVLDPDFIVADEPVSMLDVSIRSGILNLFKRLRKEREITMLYISHDLTTIDYLADRTMVMFRGNIVEVGPTDRVIRQEAHPYTETLLDAVPSSDPLKTRAGSHMRGSSIQTGGLPDGCRFAPHCDYATEECLASEPPLEAVETDHETACYHPLNQ